MMLTNFPDKDAKDLLLFTFELSTNTVLNGQKAEYTAPVNCRSSLCHVLPLKQSLYHKCP